MFGLKVIVIWCLQSISRLKRKIKIGKTKEYTFSLVGVAFVYICEPIKWNEMMTMRSMVCWAAQSNSGSPGERLWPVSVVAVLGETEDGAPSCRRRYVVFT